MVFWTGLVKRLKETVSKKYIDDNLNLKADKVNTYTKEQCDNKFGSYTYLNNNYYKKTDSDNRYYTKEQVYSKQESDSRFPSYNYMNNNYYNRTQSDERYQLKGAGGDYYTKTESDNRYYTKEQSDDRFAKDFQIISLQTQINNKADKSVVDNLQTQVNNKLNISDLKGNMKVVSNSLSGVVAQLIYSTPNKSSTHINYAGYIEKWRQKLGIPSSAKIISIRGKIYQDYSFNDYKISVYFTENPYRKTLNFTVKQYEPGDKWNSIKPQAYIEVVYIE